jgi:hypothetical protein
MKCSNCGQQLKDDATICYSCGEHVDDTKEIETIINEIIEQEDLDIQQQKNKNTSVEHKEVIKSIPVKPIKIFIASIIGIFILTMFCSWFSISGNGAYIGYVDNDITVNADTIINALVEDSKSHSITLSPFDLVNYVNKNADEHKIVNVSNNKKATSILSIMNMAFIYGLLVIIVLSIIAILLLIIPKSLKGIRVVRNLSIVSIIILVLNFISMKITYINMFMVKAKSTLIETGISNHINLTKNGVAAGNSFFPYYMNIKLGFIISLIMLLIWLLLSSFLICYKDKKGKKVVED